MPSKADLQAAFAWKRDKEAEIEIKIRIYELLLRAERNELAEIRKASDRRLLVLYKAAPAEELNRFEKAHVRYIQDLQALAISAKGPA